MAEIIARVQKYFEKIETHQNTPRPNTNQLESATDDIDDDLEH